MTPNKPTPNPPNVRSVPSPAAHTSGEPAEQQPAAEWRSARWLVAPSRRLLASLLVGSLAMNVGLLLVRTGAQQAASPARPSEIPLGTFRYVAAPSKLGESEEATISSAEFSLYVTFGEPAGEDSAELISARQFRVRQAVEQLLRQAHSGDFHDPALSALKRQLREHINAVLGARAVAEVVITDLKIDYRQPSAGSPTRQAPVPQRTGVPWKEYAEDHTP